MKEQKEEKEIFTSDFIEKLSELADTLEEKYKIKVCFTQILGNRWSYITGQKKELFLSLPERIQLDKNLGIVIYGWHKLNEDSRKEVLDFLKEKILFEK